MDGVASLQLQQDEREWVKGRAVPDGCQSATIEYVQSICMRMGSLLIKHPQQQGDLGLEETGRDLAIALPRTR